MPAVNEKRIDNQDPLEQPSGSTSTSTSTKQNTALRSVTLSGMPMHIYPYPALLPTQQPVKSKRRQVKNACTNCQKACKKCDDARPCLRCVKYGISEECVDSQRKERQKGIKRGPYKKRDGGKGVSLSQPRLLFSVVMYSMTYIISEFLQIAPATSTCHRRVCLSQTVTVVRHNHFRVAHTCHLAIPPVSMASIHHWSQNPVMVCQLCPCIPTHLTFCRRFHMSNPKCMQLPKGIIMGMRLRGFIRLQFLLQWHTIIPNMSLGRMVKVPHPCNTQGIH